MRNQLFFVARGHFMVFLLFLRKRFFFRVKVGQSRMKVAYMIVKLAKGQFSYGAFLLRGKKQAGNMVVALTHDHFGMDWAQEA